MGLPHAIVAAAMQCQLLLLAWRVQQLDQELPDAVTMEALAAARDDYIRQLEATLHSSAGFELKLEVSKWLR
jgi:hypothetical protein